MTPGEHRALADSTREALTRARDLAGRTMEVRSRTAELTVIAGDLRSRARAERERARLLAGECLRRDHASRVPPGSASAAANLAPAVPGPHPVRRDD